MVDHSDLVAAAEPEAVRAALAANADELVRAAGPHHGDALASMRRATHNGHDIVVRTSYQITVDGRPFDVHVIVDNGGRVYYHGLPTRDFASVIDLVVKAIDTFPEDFDRGQVDMPDEHGHDRGGHRHGGDH
jgi:hypothetical protein